MSRVAPVLLLVLTAAACSSAATSDLPPDAKQLPADYTLPKEIPACCEGQVYLGDMSPLCSGVMFFLCDGHAFTHYVCGSAAFPSPGWTSDEFTDSFGQEAPLSCAESSASFSTSRSTLDKDAGGDARSSLFSDSSSSAKHEVGDAGGDVREIGDSGGTCIPYQQACSQEGGLPCCTNYCGPRNVCLVAGK